MDLALCEMSSSEIKSLSATLSQFWNISFMAGGLKVQTVFFIVTVIVVNNLGIHECMIIHNKEAPSTFYFSLQPEQGRAHISLLVLSVAHKPVVSYLQWPAPPSYQF